MSPKHSTSLNFCVGGGYGVTGRVKRDIMTRYTFFFSSIVVPIAPPLFFFSSHVSHSLISPSRLAPTRTYNLNWWQYVSFVYRLVCITVSSCVLWSMQLVYLNVWTKKLCIITCSFTLLHLMTSSKRRIWTLISILSMLFFHMQMLLQEKWESWWSIQYRKHKSL